MQSPPAGKPGEGIWAILKIMAAFGYGLYYGTYHLGVPKWDPNFGNHPYDFICVFLFASAAPKPLTQNPEP